MDLKTLVADRKTLAPGASDKQLVMIAVQKGALSRLQARAVAQRMDELAGKVKDPLAAAIKELDGGEIEIPEEDRRKEKPPTFDQAPAGMGPKQVLIWLIQKGTISPAQAKQAAPLVDEAVREKKDIDLGRILHTVGATAALPEGDVATATEQKPKATRSPKSRATRTPPPAADPPPATPPADDPSTKEGEEEADEDSEDAGLTPEEVHAMNSPEVIELVKETDDLAALDWLHEAERAHPRYEGGRQTVLDAIEERKGELTTRNPNE